MTTAAAPAPPARRPRRARGLLRPTWGRALLVGGLLVQLAPVLLLPVVLSQDGPAHVDGAWVLLHHDDPGPVGQLLRREFTVDLGPVPNMLTTLLLMGLMRVLSPDVAEKVLVAGFVVLLVAGLRYALRGVHPRAGWLAVAALPFAGAQLVAYGFYNFCWGVALALFAVGLGLRARPGWRPGGCAGLTGLTGLLLLTWSAHLLPWLVAAGVVGGLAVARAAVQWRSGWAAAVRRHLLPPALALLPSASLTVVYARSDAGRRGTAVGGLSWARLAELPSLYRPLVVSSAWEAVPAAVVAAALAALLVAAVRRRPSAAPADPFLTPARVDRWVLGTATVVAAAAYLLTPDRYGVAYGFLPHRLAWFPPLLLVLFCATRPPSRAAVRAGIAGALVLAASAAVVVRLPTQLRDARTVADVLAVADEIPAGSTFLVLRYTRYGAVAAPLASAPNPLQHVSSRLAVRAESVDLGLYEAVFPYFQVQFADGGATRRLLDPTAAGPERVPPRVDLAAVRGRLDYVVVLGLDTADPDVRGAHRTARVLTELRAHYRLVSPSRPGDDVAVWRFGTG